MKNNKWCVYKHTSPSKGVYIGITKQNPVIRWSKSMDGIISNMKYFSLT